MKKNRKTMKYIVTTVQRGALVNKNLLSNLLAFAKTHKVKNIYTFVMNGKCKDEDWIDPRITEAGIEIIETLTLNKNLRCRDMKVKAQKILPFNGLNSKLPRDCSHILPATKIRLEMLSNLSKHPRALISTGALTQGNYRLNTMIGMKAQEQHQFGFVYVQIKSNKIFDAYQMDCQKNGNFHYMTEFYHNGKSSYKQPECVVLGDLHVGIIEKKSLEASKAQLRELKPKFCVLHDIFDGRSVNHHTQHSFMTALKNYKEKRDSLDKELKEVLKVIEMFATEFPDIKFLVAESNHDVFLRRYIDEVDFRKNPQNFFIISSMIPEMMKEKKPTLQIAIELLGDIPENFRFFLENDEFRIRGVNVASHGHLGVSGSRGNPKSFDNQNFRQMSGHTHKPQRLANVVVVGTNSILQQDYMKGPGAHAHANGIIYADGHQGLIIMVL